MLTFPYLGRAHRRARPVGVSGLDAACQRAAYRWLRLAGTCMEAGKTAAAPPSSHACVTADSRSMPSKPRRVSLRRSIAAFEDSGARRTMFTDLGIVTTTAKCGQWRRTMLTGNGERPAGCIVFELGDGCLGPMAWNPSLRTGYQERR